MRKQPRTIRSKARHICVIAGLLLFIGACDDADRHPVVMKPLHIAGAEYVGEDTCATSDCHQTQWRYFGFNEHAETSIALSDDDVEAGEAEACETCHGPGSLHVENRGRVAGQIVKPDSETCFSCHPEIRAKFALQYHHPVPEGLMQCTDCHSMHGRDVVATGGSMLMGQWDRCFKCHKDKRGPFVFEHDAMRDGCPTCHNPHGSINNKLLVAGPTILCIRCHWESSFNTSTADLGSHAHSSANIAAGQDCVDCHTAIHGSNVWRSLRK